MVRRARPRGGRADRRARGRQRPRRDPDRARDGQARDRHRPLAGDARGRARARGRPAASSCARATCASSSSTSRSTLVICPFRSLLHLPTLGGQAAGLRARRRVAAARRAVRLERLRLQPADRGAARRDDASTQSGVVHIDPLRPGRQPHRASTRGRRRRTRIRLWWVTKSEWDGLIDVAGLEVEALYGGFDREPFDDDSLEFVYVARKPVSVVRPDRAALRPVERERRRGHLVLRRRGARRGRHRRRARRRHGPHRDPDRRWPACT